MFNATGPWQLPATIIINFIHTLKPFLQKHLSGRGVFTTRRFSKGDFLLEYKGELVSHKEGCEREISYPEDLGSYLSKIERKAL